MQKLALSLSGALILAVSPALAQDSGSSGGSMEAQTELVGNMGKIEANIAESQARLFTHMLLPEDDSERESYAQAFTEDIESVDSYLETVMNSDVPQAAMDELEQFQSQWTDVKEMATGLTSASRDNLASTEDIKSYSSAVLELDDYIDAALVAAGLPDDDDGPESGSAGMSSDGSSSGSSGGSSSESGSSDSSMSGSSN